MKHLQYKGKRKTSTHHLRLIRWSEDGYPPIDLSNEFDAVIELIMNYRRLEDELRKNDR